eukprot:SAG31_NODE_43_length_31224_cov_10.112578_12_plen_60_part_00
MLDMMIQSCRCRSVVADRRGSAMPSIRIDLDLNLVDGALTLPRTGMAYMPVLNLVPSYM